MKKVSLKGLTWDDPRGYGPLAAVADAYQARNPSLDLKIHWDVQPLSGFESRPLESIVGEYDLVVADHPHVAGAARSGLLVPIEDVKDSFVSRCFESYFFEGKLWAVPVDAACHIVAYCPSRIECPPATWDDVAALARSGVRFAVPLAGVHSLMALLSLVGSQQEDGDGAFVGLEKPKCRIGLELLRWLRRRVMEQSLMWNPIEALEALVAEQCDCVLLTFGYAHFQKQGVQFAPLPAFAPGRVSRGVLGGAGMAVSAQSEEPAIAVDFARFCAAGPTQATVWPAHAGQPAHRDAWAHLAAYDLFYRDTRSAMDTALLRPRAMDLSLLQQIAGTAIQEWLASDNSNPTSLYPILDRLHCGLAA